jgi:hypothetical protein
VSERKESEMPRIRHRNAANHYRHLTLVPPLDPTAMLSARGESRGVAIPQYCSIFVCRCGRILRY